MTEKPEASVLTARRAAQHFRLSSADDAYEHLYILTVRSSLGPLHLMLADTPLPHGFGAALASVDTFFPRAPEQFVTSPLCLVGYVRWDARSDRVPPLQTIIFSSFPGRTKGCRQLSRNCVGRWQQVRIADRWGARMKSPQQRRSRQFQRTMLPVFEAKRNSG